MMKPEIVNELKRRAAIYKEHEPVIMDSLRRYRMLMCPIGAAVVPEPWMDESYTAQIMSTEEFNSDVYDDLFFELFKEHFLGTV